MLRTLKAHDRLDEVSEAVGALGLVTARMVDEADAGKEKGYALAKLTTAHLGVLVALSRLVGPVPAGDAFGAFLAEMSTPSTYEEGRASAERAARYWDEHGIGR